MPWFGALQQRVEADAAGRPAAADAPLAVQSAQQPSLSGAASHLAPAPLAAALGPVAEKANLSSARLPKVTGDLSRMPAVTPHQGLLAILVGQCMMLPALRDLITVLFWELR